MLAVRICCTEAVVHAVTNPLTLRSQVMVKIKAAINHSGLVRALVISSSV